MSTWQLVKVPAIITLAISLIRLIGELAGWAPALFSAEAGGGAALVGITWWVFIFGFYFGLRLAREGRGPEVPGRVIITYVVAIVVVFLLIAMFVGFPEEVATPEEGATPVEVTSPEEGASPSTSGFLIVMAGAWICSLVTLLTWSELTRALLLYGFAARIPVMVITLLAVAFGWETHHVALAPGMPEMAGVELALFASLPQIGFWIPFTVLVGGLFGGIGAMVGRRKEGVEP